MEKIYDREPDGVESYCINQIEIYLTMNMINKGIPYFPTPANFFDEEVMELLEAKFGVLASYIVMRLLCKIYKEVKEIYDEYSSDICWWCRQPDAQQGTTEAVS